MNQTVEKQALPIVLNDKSEPVAIIFFNQQRDRIIYMLHKADEEEIISLLASALTLTSTKNDKN